MEKKFNITIANNSYLLRDAPYCPKSINVGSMSVIHIREYLQQLSMNKIPEESCISSINAYFRSKDNISLYITRDRSHIPTEDNSGNFTIYIENINGCKCSTRNCMNNLADGKCTDRFVIEKIGKKFFADKYKDENTKQR